MWLLRRKLKLMMVKHCQNSAYMKLQTMMMNQMLLEMMEQQQISVCMRASKTLAAASKKFLCLECNKMFSTAFSLKRHQKRHVPSRKVYPCSSCDKKFVTMASVQTHILIMHQNQRSPPIVCDQCGMLVLSKTALEEHMLTHTDYAPYECDTCKKCFKTVSRLKQDKETHDPRKYICTECGMQLNSRQIFYRHKQVHTDQRNHKCDYCGRQYKRGNTLKYHLLMHAGLKPYSCDFCNRTFVSGSNCRTHKKKQHPKELAAQEASGRKRYHQNIPKIETLKAFTKDKDNLSQMATND